MLTLEYLAHEWVSLDYRESLAGAHEGGDTSLSKQCEPVAWDRRPDRGPSQEGVNKTVSTKAIKWQCD